MFREFSTVGRCFFNWTPSEGRLTVIPDKSKNPYRQGRGDGSFPQIQVETRCQQERPRERSASIFTKSTATAVARAVSLGRVPPQSQNARGRESTRAQTPR
jgi:hypothetical protein